MKITTLSSFAALSILLLSSCGDDGGTRNVGSPACRQQLEAMQACGYRTEGHWFCYDDATLLRACWGECATQITCEELNTCDYPDCYRECFLQFFECGDGETTSSSHVCDGTPNCANGADEAGCPVYTFECEDGSGSVIAGELVCDGTPDCEDASDENCAETLVPCTSSAPR